ncbi:MAG TPA: hypothetical protein VLK33_07810 [Terriglobales bacterium]|nr:hypothetical protein [Terriglobales bacterium]
MKISAFGSLAGFEKMAPRALIHDIVFICAAVLLAASCGGGGSSTGSTGNQGTGQGTVSFSTNSISFKTAGPFAQVPPTQLVTGTVTNVTSGTLFVTIQSNAPNGFFTLTSVTTAGSSAQVGVVPGTPSSLSAGSYSGSITVNVCLNDPTCKTGQLSGSPKTISVSYVVGSGVDGDTVTPRVVPANVAGTVILRGTVFTGATNVSFGSSAAASMTVVSDTEIDVSYPSLAAGTYPITINSGGISYTATLIAFAPPAFSATLISPPTSDIPAGIEYDAQRTALFVSVAQAPPNFKLQRYAFDKSTNTWGSPTQITMQNLVQFHLSPDGSHLLALVQGTSSQADMLELDPVSLQQTNSTPINTPEVCGFVLANDGNGIVGNCSPSQTPGFVFGTFSHTVSPMPFQTAGIRPTVASANGAIVALDGTNFVASTETVSQTGTVGYSADLIGDKFIDANGILSQTGQILGFVSTPFPGVDIINWAGTRVYGYNPSSTSCVPTLSTFDLTAPPSGGQYPEIGNPVSLAQNCDLGGDQLAITPDGSAIFIVTTGGVFVQPLP